MEKAESHFYMIHCSKVETYSILAFLKDEHHIKIHYQVAAKGITGDNKSNQKLPLLYCKECLSVL